MKKVILMLLVCSVLLPITPVHSDEPIPSKEFVLITENVLDALDEIEVVLSSYHSTKYELKMAFKKLDIALMKYRRYVEDWRKLKYKSKQSSIVSTISTAHCCYRTTEVELELKELGKAKKNEGRHGKTHERARRYAQEARELLTKYKQSL